jgi:hypothetical protein
VLKGHQCGPFPLELGQRADLVLAEPTLQNQPVSATLRVNNAQLVD